MKKYLIPLLALTSVFSNAYGQQPIAITPSDAWSSVVLSQDKSILIKKSYTTPKASPATSSADYNASVTYYDNFGFTDQHIEVNATPNSLGDIVTPAEHDYLWRDDVRSYLPYAASGTNGMYINNAQTQQSNWYRAEYGGNHGALTWKNYEKSIRNVVLSETIPGIGASHCTSMNYSVNNDSDNVCSIAFSYPNASALGTFTVSGTYPAGSLYKTAVTDADGRKVITFTDGAGKTILERRVLTDATQEDSGVYADTYYIYDGLDRLRVVVSPEGSAQLTQGQYTATSSVSLLYCYLYTYDDRDRLVEKRIPGKAVEYIVYDKGNRVVMTQDGNMRAENKWTYSVYDCFDRLTDQSIVVSTNSNMTRELIQRAFDSTTVAYHPYVSSSVVNPAIIKPFATGFTVDMVTYSARYDNNSGVIPDYLSFEQVHDVTPANVSDKTKGLKIYEKSAVIGEGVAGNEYTERAFYYDSKGRVVQTVERNHLGGTSRYSTKYNFTGNILTVHESHNTGFVVDTFVAYIPGIYLRQPDGRTSLAYPFVCTGPEGVYFHDDGSIDNKFLICSLVDYSSGFGFPYNYYYIPNKYINLVKETIAQNPEHGIALISSYFPGKGIPEVGYYEQACDVKETNFTYDKRGRLLSESVRLNYGDAAITGYEYDDLGKLQVKRYAGELVEYMSDKKLISYYNYPVSEIYDYSIQGWLTGQRSRLFEMDLRYDSPLSLHDENGLLERKPSYTGNISQWSWIHSDNATDNLYDFDYDGLGRLTDAKKYPVEAYTILSAGKFDEKGITYDLNGNIMSLTRTNGEGEADNLTYTYNGNQLDKLVISNETTALAKESYLIDRQGVKYTFSAYDVITSLYIGLITINGTPINKFSDISEIVFGDDFLHITELPSDFISDFRSAEKIDLSGFRNVTTIDYRGMFWYSIVQSLDLSMFTKLTSVGDLFLANLYELRELNIGSVDWSNITVGERGMLNNVPNEQQATLRADSQALADAFKAKFPQVSNWTVVINEPAVVTIGSNNTNQQAGPFFRGETPAPANESYLIDTQGVKHSFNADDLPIYAFDAVGGYITINDTEISKHTEINEIVFGVDYLDTTEIPYFSLCDLRFAEKIDLLGLRNVTYIDTYGFGEHNRLQSLDLSMFTKLKRVGDYFLAYMPALRKLNIGSVDWSNITVGNDAFSYTPNDSSRILYADSQALANAFKAKVPNASNWRVVINQPKPINIDTYTYDANGNMTFDPRKGLQFEYNFLNLLQKAETAAESASYKWLADGTKAQVVDADGNGYAYIGSLTYKMTAGVPALESTGFGSGRIVVKYNPEYPEKKVYDRQYFITDHLGSVRVVFDQSGEVIARNDYYPFGKQHDNPALIVPTAPEDNRFLFNGKEKQLTGSLGLLDYGWRMYDPEVARWFGVDPLAEKFISHSPYAFSGNNPIRYVDPDGLEFTEAAWGWVKDLIKEIEEREKKNNERIEAKKAELAQGGLSDRRSRKLNRQIGRLERSNADMEAIRGEIAALSLSGQMYDVIDSDKYNTNNLARGGAEFNFSNGNFEITMPINSGLGLFAHELKHAYQFETGEFSTGHSISNAPHGYTTFLYDQSDETAAYNRGALFGQQQSRHMSYKLPEGPVDITNYPNLDYIKNIPIDKQSDVYQNIANNIRQAFRVGGKTYYKPR